MNGYVASGPALANFGNIHSHILSDAVNVVVTGMKDRRIQLWDIKSGNHLLDLTGHKGLVEALALSPDGYTLASGGSEMTILLWDLRAATAQKKKPKARDCLWQSSDRPLA